MPVRALQQSCVLGHFVGKKTSIKNQMPVRALQPFTLPYRLSMWYKKPNARKGITTLARVSMTSASF